jgi:hypothetical protein
MSTLILLIVFVNAEAVAVQPAASPQLWLDCILATSGDADGLSRFTFAPALRAFQAITGSASAMSGEIANDPDA